MESQPALAAAKLSKLAHLNIPESPSTRRSRPTRAGLSPSPGSCAAPPPARMPKKSSGKGVPRCARCEFSTGPVCVPLERCRCRSCPYQSAHSHRSLACAGPVYGCNQPLTEKLKFHCTKCGQDVCLEHQYSVDHDCIKEKKPSGPPASSIKVVQTDVRAPPCGLGCG
jgi:hypothetical protein